MVNPSGAARSNEIFPEKEDEAASAKKKKNQKNRDKTKTGRHGVI